MSISQVVYIVDDEEAVRKSLSLLMKSIGLEACHFASGQEFLEAYEPSQAACLLLDVRMPGMSGLDLQRELSKREIDVPVIMISGQGDVPMAVRAMKAGAVDFIEKPFDTQELLTCVNDCIQGHTQQRIAQQQRTSQDELLARLTPREHEVMNELVAGKRNKQIAADLGISTRTVELHRASVMQKLEARSLSDVVRLALRSDA